MKIIQSRDNPYFKQVYRWARHGRLRRQDGVVLLDGLHLLQSLRDVGGVLDCVLVSNSGAGRQEILEWLTQNEQVVFYRLPDTLFAQLATTENPTGVLGVARLPTTQHAPLLDEDCIILDGVQDPGNVGGLLRTAAAAGINQALLGPGCADAWAPKTLRAAQGAQFALRIYEHCDLLSFMQHYSGRVLVTAPQAMSTLYEVSLMGPLAWVFGSEGQGVSASVEAMADGLVSIPLQGKIESLNVAAAAAICLFETLRYRRQFVSE